MSTHEERCEHCGHVRRTYKRKFPIGDLRALYSLYRHDAIWVHIKDLDGKSGGGDFAKFRYWGLIEERENDDPSKKNAGYWRLTAKGLAFVRERLEIRTHAVVVDGECIRLEGEWIGIRKLWILGGFDLRELMAPDEQGVLI